MRPMRIDAMLWAHLWGMPGAQLSWANAGRHRKRPCVRNLTGEDRCETNPARVSQTSHAGKVTYGRHGVRHSDALIARRAGRA